MKSWMSLLLAAWMVSVAAAEQEPARQSDAIPKVDCRCYESDGWHIQQTDNFRICTRIRQLDLDNLPARCEWLRTRITRVCLDTDQSEPWTPRCDVIVHASLAEYQQALGTSVGRSMGCATMKVDGGRIVSRRIDIRVDADAWDVDALPHELSHVVMAAHFNGRRLPPWADEGIGVLSESTRKQQIRAKAFRESARHGYVYRPAELMSLRRFPAAGYREAFYAQSAALVRELTSHGSPRDFIRCIEQTLEQGETRALANVYGIRSPDSLDEITDVQSVTRALSHEPVTSNSHLLTSAFAD